MQRITAATLDAAPLDPSSTFTYLGPSTTPIFYSYRREGAGGGRNLVLVAQ